MTFVKGNHPKTEFKEGCVPWNKDLTKENDERIKYQGEKHSRVMIEKWKNIEYRTKTTNAHVGHIQTKQTRDKHSRSIQKYYHNPLNRKKQGLRTKKLWKNPKYRQKIMESRSLYWEDPESHKKHSLMLKKRWSNPLFQKQMKIANNIKPNKSEQFLNKILQQVLPNEYKYIGDFSYFIGTKNPDFININGKKKLIDLFGDHWHSKTTTGKSEIENETERISYFKKYGFDCLVIWDSELKNNFKMAKQRIIDFTNYV